MNSMQNDIIFNDNFITHRQAMCIVACAGSGKTTTIIQKIKYMIEHLKCLPSEFVICTFTNNSTNDIIQRINIKNLTINTFHSMALEELIKYNYKITPNTPDPIPEEYLIKYLQLLNDQSYTNNFKYIFIDEFQDINQYQYDIILKWYDSCRLLVVVGDDQQNIYTFRNTSIKYILNFCTDFNGEYYYLYTNYRSNIGIVNVSNHIIKHNKNRIDKQILCGTVDKLIKPKIRFFNNQLDEYKYILKAINLIDSSLSIGILCRTNKKLYKLENYLYVNKVSVNRCRLLTIHSSKGLEFDHVIIINCVDGVIPLINSDIEEERRLFYVGCTRAKKTLLITSIWYDIYQPSRFIYELYTDRSLLDINNFEWILKDKPLTDNKIRLCRLDRLLSNSDIEIYTELINNRLLPQTDQTIYLIIKVHDPLLDDVEIRFDHIELCVIRLIYQLLHVDNYIYLEYLLNTPKFFNHSRLFRSNILKYLNNNSNIDQLNSSLEYLNLDLKLNDKDLNMIANSILNINKYNLRFDHNVLLNSSKKLLTDANIKFQDKNLNTIDIIDYINQLSICKDLIQGKYTSQYLIPNIQSTIRQHLQLVSRWLESIINNCTYVDYNYQIVINDRLINKIDLIIDNRMILICYSRPTMIDYIKYIMMIAKYNNTNHLINQLNLIQLYNPILGTILEFKVDFDYMDLYMNLINN